MDIDQDVIQIAKGNAKLNNVRPKFVQADIFPWLRDAQANGERFDVVILDCHMFGKDGFETLADLKKLRQAPRILMTAETRDAHLEKRARSEGAGDFLIKPFYAKDIDAAFSRLLGLTHLRWA